VLDRYIPDFLRYLRFEKRMSEHTYIGYQQDLHQFAQYISEHYPSLQDIAALELFHLRSWMVHLTTQQAQPRTLQRKASSLKSFLKFLLRNKLIENNPAAYLRTPKAARRIPVYLEEKESSKILEFEQPSAPDDAFEKSTAQLIINLLYQSGMRRGELCKLNEHDIDFNRKQLRVLGKRNKERMIPASDSLLADIQRYIELKRGLFTEIPAALLVTQKGRPVYAQYIYRIVNQHLKDCTIARKSPHVLRHTFATQLSNNGADLNAIKELLGHSSLAATQIYTHSNIEKLKEQYRKAHPKS
jgi:integrase/recombinase XerC